MSTLTNLPNIGKELAKSLKLAGIKTIDELMSIETEDIFIKLKTIDPSSCINRLYAIEGAKQGIRWHNLNKEYKQRLLDFFKTLD